MSGKFCTSPATVARFDRAVVRAREALAQAESSDPRWRNLAVYQARQALMSAETVALAARVDHELVTA